MHNRTLIAVAVAGALSVLASPILLAATIDNRAAEVVAVGADPLLAVESNRAGIVERLVADHRSALAASGIGEDLFRASMYALRADELLAASLVNSLQEVTAIVSAQPVAGNVVSRYFAVAPTSVLAALPTADGYLVRDNGQLTVVKAAQLQLNANTQLVGYFVANTSVVKSPTAIVTPKDGPGSGANSWIGYVAGNNVASGSGSAVAAGTFNAANNTNASVFAGQSNVAGGISSLVIGGFDNQALAIDSLVGSGAGNRATGPRSVVVGGGYNLASGPWSFIGGGGRQTGSGVAGTAAQDHIASAQWSGIAAGVGNRATNTGAFIGGGGYNVASGVGSFVGGGGIYTGLGAFPNVASGVVSTVAAGIQNTASGDQSFIGGGYLNTASAINAAVLGGFNNLAAGTGSVAMGWMAKADHDRAFTFSDGSSGNFHSTAANTFNVLAVGGVKFVTAASNVAGEANATQTVNITPVGELTFPEQGRQQIRIRNGSGLAQGMGGQTSTLYFRTNSAFAWFIGGVHSDNFEDPGGGGAVMATLNNVADTTTVIGTFRAQAFTATSDRNAKTDFTPLDAKLVLAKVAKLPVSTWSYKNEKDSGVRHIGPTAQDFQALFAVGYDDKSIATVDADGVALAAIKGLQEELQDRDAKATLQQVAIDTQQAQLAAQQKRIAALEEQIGVLAATQLQMQDLAQLVSKMQQELAWLRQGREVAVALH